MQGLWKESVHFAAKLLVDRLKAMKMNHMDVLEEFTCIFQLEMMWIFSLILALDLKLEMIWSSSLKLSLDQKPMWTKTN